MHVAEVRLVNFRSYHDTRISFTPGLNVIVGENASGKTNLLEGAYYALRGASPRTTRDDKLISWGEDYTRVEVKLGDAHAVQVFYAAGQGKRVRVDGAEAANLDDVRRRAQAFIFVPESLLLVKGGPARRRTHIDVFGAALDPGYRAALAALQGAVRQRNAQLLSVRAGASESSLDPWDAQLAAAGADLGRRRRELVERLARPFAVFAAALTPWGGACELRLRSALAEFDYEPGPYLAALRDRRHADVQRGISGLGPHRDDVELVELAADAVPGAQERFPDGARDLRLFGSQGEQRAAVLALLLAERQVAAEVTGDLGTLFLDDVMSELDEDRRRLLVGALASPGQAIITTTTIMYFTPEELDGARVIELPPGRAAGSRG